MSLGVASIDRHKIRRASLDTGRWSEKRKGTRGSENSIVEERETICRLVIVELPASSC